MSTVTIARRAGGFLALQLATCLALTPVAAAHAAAPDTRPRIVLMHDPELDDQNTLVRFLLYSNEFRVEALMYASSDVHWAGDGKGTLWFVPGAEYTRFGLSLCPCTSWRWKPGERFIDEAVDRYAEVYPNLRRHAAGYPAPGDLRAKIVSGNVSFSRDYSTDTDGSRLIAQLLLDDQPGKLYLLSGAGQSTIARALKSIQDAHGEDPDWPALRSRISAKAVIISFGDQDKTYGSYIGPHWPDIEFRQVATETWGYGARNVVLAEDARYLSASWTRDNVSSMGPLGAFYRVWGDHKQMVPGDIFDYFGLEGLSAEELRQRGYVVWTPPQAAGSWISEGDSPIFLNLVDNGLRSGENATFGGWAGRTGIDHDSLGNTPREYAATRWFGAAQRDFAARMKWSVASRFSLANHPPQLRVQGALERTARPGQRVELAATATDPDNDPLRGRWWQYVDAGTYPGHIPLAARSGLRTTVRIPNDARPGQAIHMIAEVVDGGTPALSHYQRVIIHVGSSPPRN